MKAGLETSKTALLVLIGGLADGTKVVLAVARGVRLPPLSCAIRKRVSDWIVIGTA